MARERARIGLAASKGDWPRRIAEYARDDQEDAAAYAGCVGSKDAGDSPLACDAVQVVFVTWLGMAGHVGVGPAARIT